MDAINSHFGTNSDALAHRRPRTRVRVRARVVPARSTHRMHARDPASLATMERTAHSTHARARRQRAKPETMRCVAERPQTECLQQELKRMDGVARFRLVVA